MKKYSITDTSWVYCFIYFQDMWQIPDREVLYENDKICEAVTTHLVIFQVGAWTLTSLHKLMLSLLKGYAWAIFLTT